jgi:Family of unknown function (DUF6516)
MLLDLVRQYRDLIQAVEVERFRVVGTSYELKAVLLLKNGSQLFVKDYVFLDGARKYAYHWQDSVGQLISRWDNAPHWKGVKTFPHHRHAEQGSQVESSPVRTLEDVLKFIRASSQANRE